MPRFVYTARNPQGQVLKGALEAETEKAAAALLRGEGYLVTGLALESGRSAGSASRARVRVGEGPRVGARMLYLFCQQAGTLIRSGIPVTNALQVCATQSGNPGWSATLESVRKRVEEGDSLSGALARFGNTFPGLMTNLIEAGEVSGTLDVTFERLAQHFRREHELRRKVVGSLTYPTVILLAAIAVVVLLLVFVLPNFVTMFQGLGIVLPLPTRVLMSVGRSAQSVGLFFVAGLFLLVLAVVFYLRTDQGRRAKDVFLLKLPLVGPLLLQIELTRFARTLATLIAGGVPALQAVQICAKVSSNTRLAQAFGETAEAIRTGSRVATALERTGMIPAMTVQMISVGEATGSLDSILGNMADLYDLEVENRLQAATTLIEPAVILGVGLLVALVISSVLLPMFNMIGQLG